MEDFFTKLGIEDFTNKVADKVIERGADKIAERVVEKIKPFLGSNVSKTEAATPDSILTRKQVADLLQVSEPTLRKMGKEGVLKPYGIGTRRIRYKKLEVITALDKL